MRTLELNKTNLWYVERLEDVEVVDEDGHFTGELETSYSEPKPIRLHLYPANGDVLEQSFGLHADLDFVTSTSIALNIGTLILRDNMVEYKSWMDSHNLTWKDMSEHLWGKLVKSVDDIDVTVDDFLNNYYLKLDKILPSLNTYTYGLKGRR